MLDHLDTDSVSTVKAFAAVARPIIRSEYDVDSCIASTRIAIDVFHHFGLQARPMVARMRVFNPAMGRCFGETGPYDATAFERCDREHGARTASIEYAVGREIPAGCWAGHLVALVERQLLVDASADQASCPHNSIYLPGVLIAPVTPKFRAGLAQLIISSGDGCGILYDPYPSERSYRSAPYWKSSPTSQLVTNAIIAAMRSSLDAGRMSHGRRRLTPGESKVVAGGNRRPLWSLPPPICRDVDTISVACRRMRLPNGSCYAVQTQDTGELVTVRPGPITSRCPLILSLIPLRCLPTTSSHSKTTVLNSSAPTIGIRLWPPSVRSTFP